MTATKRRRPHSTEDFAKFAHRIHKAWEKRALAEDPWAAADMIKASERLEASGVRAIAELRGYGYTWDEIGRELGLSGATTCKRYAVRVREIQSSEEIQS